MGVLGKAVRYEVSSGVPSEKNGKRLVDIWLRLSERG